MNWVNEIDLEGWSDALASKNQFPHLIRRLLHATVEQMTLVEFPAGEGVQREGWDGLVETAAGNAFVPTGTSVWESGVTVKGKLKGKADEDFEKRSKDPLGLDPSQTTFIFVTPRKWAKKAEWVAEKNALGIWREVRVYDSANFEEWLETAPAVDAWLAHLLGKRPTGVIDIETHWQDLASLTEPSLAPQVFLCSREEEVKALAGWLGGPPSVLAYEARSPHDVIDFVAAYVATLGSPGPDGKGARIAIVEEPESWRVLASSRNRLTLLPKPSLPIEPEMVSHAIRHGHQVLLSSHRFKGNDAVSRTLPRPLQYDLQKALFESGFDEERARRLARESRRSLSVLKRRVSLRPGNSQPAWSRSGEASSLMPIVLAGGWSDAVGADRGFLSKLAGTSYEELLKVAHRWLASEDPPVLLVGSLWGLCMALRFSGRGLDRTHAAA